MSAPDDDLSNLQESHNIWSKLYGRTEFMETG